MNARHGRGRPRASDRATLQEAAFELFLEVGYHHTTIEQISQRAGVSRNTFFGYFRVKSDVFWVEVDASLDRLDVLIAEEQGHSTDPADATARAVAILERIAADYPADRVPWALTQHPVIGHADELHSSGHTRLMRFAAALTQLLSAGAAQPTLEQRTRAYALVGATLAAALGWAAAGVGRGDLTPWLTRAYAAL